MKKKLTYLEKLCVLIHKEGTNKEVAERLGISPQYLGDIMNGHRGLSYDVAYRIDTILGVDVFPLLEGQLQKEWADYLKGRV